MSDSPESETVEIDGHKVPVAISDWFYDGETGERVTDDQWDESKRRRDAHS